MNIRNCFSTACLIALSACDSPPDAPTRLQDPTPASPRVIGGKPAHAGEYPFAVHLAAGGSLMCGGSLIAPDYVLTAAHCVTDTTRPGLSEPGDFVATIGRIDVADDDGEVHELSEVLRHPLYDPVMYSHDVALLRLSEPSKLSPVELSAPHSGSDRFHWVPGAMSTVIGWGWTGDELSNTLLEVSMPVVADAAVADKFGDGFDPATMVGAGYEAGGKDSCLGDSGGPLMVMGPRGFEQFGVVSWGFGCAEPGMPGIYSRVGSQVLHRWLRSVLHQTPAVGDVDGDGRDDIVAFVHTDAGAGPQDVRVALSDGSDFGPAAVWRDAWADRGHVPALGDFDGDGRDDIWVFTAGDVRVALSTGADFGGATHTSPPGSTNDREIGRVGDVDGDGRADAVLFAADDTGDVHVMLSTDDGFAPRTRWRQHFAHEGVTPQLADVDGDGRDDLVSFTQGLAGNRVYVARSTGSDFDPQTVWNNWFALPGEAPAVGDFDGGGNVDVASLAGNGSVYVGASDGASSFTASRWSDLFGDANDTLLTGDVDGDGRDDLIRFTQDHAADVFVALSTGDRFADPHKAHEHFAP